MKLNAAASASSAVFIFSFALFFSAPAFAVDGDTTVSIKDEEQVIDDKKGVCPNCSSNLEVVQIIYGYPSEVLIEESKVGKVKLGGCVIRENNPQWYCKKCDKSW